VGRLTLGEALGELTAEHGLGQILAALATQCNNDASAFRANGETVRAEGMQWQADSLYQTHLHWIRIRRAYGLASE
jgi:hypothetical protein